MKAMIGWMLFVLVLIVVVLLWGCAGGYDGEYYVPTSTYAAYDVPDPQYIPVPVQVQPSVIPQGTIDTAFHPAPLIPTR
jgi:hypothetical protein